jgi:hypothetical protein
LRDQPRRLNRASARLRNTAYAAAAFQRGVTEGVMPYRDARVACGAGRMNALSLWCVVRCAGWSAHHYRDCAGFPLSTPGGFLLPTFLCPPRGQRKVGAAPHRGNIKSQVERARTLAHQGFGGNYTRFAEGGFDTRGLHEDYGRAFRQNIQNARGDVRWPGDEGASARLHRARSEGQSFAATRKESLTRSG